MPRTGGVFSLLSGSKGSPNTTIQSAPYNAQLDDFVQDANQPRPITAGGTGATNVTQAKENFGLANVASSGSASDLTTGTLDDARLPSTMSSKTINGDLVVKSDLYVDNPTYRQINFRNSSGAIQASVISNGDDGSLIIRLNNDAGTLVRDFKIPRTGNITLGSDTVWTSGNDGSASGLDADLLDGQQGSWFLSRTNHTGQQATSTVTGLDTALAAKVARAGDTMTDTLTLQRLVNAFWAGLKIHNTGTNDAALQIAAGNRGFTGNHIELGQRNSNGAAYIWVSGKQWVLDPAGNMSLPNGGVVYENGNVRLGFGGLNTGLDAVLGRMRNVRLSSEATNNVNRSGWNIAPNGAYVTGIFKDSSGEIQNYAYRYIQQTDLFGNWANVPTL